MGNSAEIPMIPNPLPIQMFRGKQLTDEIAEAIFIGHLNGAQSEHDKPSPLGRFQATESWSWKVVCGQNPAYDYFSCQHQIFYKDKKGKLWYDHHIPYSVSSNTILRIII